MRPTSRRGFWTTPRSRPFWSTRTDPDLYQLVLRTGWIGNITRTAEGEYKTELRGLTQALSQGIVRTYGVGCDAELGDARCTVDMTPFTTTSTRRDRDQPARSSTTAGAAARRISDRCPAGTVTWTSGANTGYAMEIKEHVSPAPTRDALPADAE